MQAEIITIGDELLIGQVVDTNSAWMSQKLDDAGFEVNRATSVHDSGEAIKNAVREAMSRVKIILLTGGLGPTKDDITKHTLCELFGTKLVFNERILEDVKSFLKGRVKNINELNRGQAMVPEACLPIPNPVGTAPIMWFDYEGAVIVSMPGVPSEMKNAMEHEIIPRLKQKFRTKVILHQTVLVFNIPEAVLAEMLTEWEEQLPADLSVAYLPAPGKIRLRITGRGNNETEVSSKLDTATAGLEPIIGQNIFSYNDVQVQEILGDLLKKKRQTLAVAESCTGGMMGHLITSVPGSSAYFKGGVIAYANDIKEKVLGVKAVDLDEQGAVSQAVVEQMALGAKALLGTDYALATSGIAGPEGGTVDKPVGTVWLAMASPEGVWSKQFQFGTIRERNVQRSAETALVMLIKHLEGLTIAQIAQL